VDLRGKNWQVAEEDFTVRSFINCTLRQTEFGWSSQGGWLGGACSTDGRDEKCAQNFVRKTWRGETSWEIQAS